MVSHFTVFLLIHFLLLSKYILIPLIFAHHQRFLKINPQKGDLSFKVPLAFHKMLGSCRLPYPGFEHKHLVVFAYHVKNCSLKYSNI